MDGHAVTAMETKWTDLIESINGLALGWYTAIRRPDVLTAPARAGSVGASVVRTPGGIAGQVNIDPTILMIGAALVVGVVALVLFRR